MKKRAHLALWSILLCLIPAFVTSSPARAALASSDLVLNLDASVAGSYANGTWQDQSASGLNATAMNAPTLDATDGSINFNGTNQYFNLGDVLPMTGAFTVEVTFMPTSLSTTQGIVARQNSSRAGNYFVGISGSKAKYYVESSPWGISSSTTLATGTKYTMAMVYDSAKAITPYLNGVQDGTKTPFGTALGGGNINLQIGAMLNADNPSDFFNGKIYSVRIYNRALTSSEVSTNYAESTKIVLSNWAAATGCTFNASQRHGTKFTAGTTSTITKVRLQVEFNAPDNLINATQVDIHADTAGAVGTLIGTLRPTILDAASTLPGANVQSRRVAYTGAVNVTSGTTYWITANGNGNTMSLCGTGEFSIQNSSWVVPKSSGSFYLRFDAGNSYTTWFNIFQFEMSLGAPDTTAPVVTGPGSSTSASVATSTLENSNWSHTYTANEYVTWSITGSDSATFTINQSGVLSLGAKNFEVKTDANSDGVFSVTVRATDSSSNTGTQSLSLTIDDDNEFPVISFNGGASTHSITVAENQVSVVTYTGSDPDTGTTLGWYFADNSFDQNKFNINVNTGVLTFKVSPDFEVPTDTNGDNVYKVNIALFDGANLATQLISVTISNVNEGSSINKPTISATIYKGVTVAITVSADTVGKVRFFVNGKKIANCLAVATTGSEPNVSATCNYKPSVQGNQTIVARLTPSNSGFTSSTSPALSITVLKRQNRR